MSLFDDAAVSIRDYLDNVDHVASPTGTAKHILAPLRAAVQELFEDWLGREMSHYWEWGGGKKYFNASDVWRAGKARAESLGLEWRHEAELAEQLDLDSED